MLTKSDVKDWLKGYGMTDHYYTGVLNAKQDKSIGVYNRKSSGAPVTALGRLSSYDVKAISILLHWTNNAVETEKVAIQLFKKIRAEKQLKINNVFINTIVLQVPQPIEVGADENGVYEYVIDFDLYYTRSE